MGREIELRACCGKLRWALLDAIEPLAPGTTIEALRWGTGVIPLNLDTASAEPAELVASILTTTEQWLGGAGPPFSRPGAPPWSFEWAFRAPALPKGALPPLRLL